MFHIIKPEDRSKNQALIDEMHRTRYDVVVKQWGWEIPGITDGYDKDQFDTDETVYVVVTDTTGGGVVASSRINPTTSPHMLSELFVDFCDLQDYPVGADVWECSRFVIDRTLFNDPVAEFRSRCQLSIGITQHCVSENITRLSWLTHQKFYNIAQRVWKTEPLGLPRRDTADGWAWIAAVSQMDIATLQLQKDRFDNAEEIVAGYMGEKAKRASGKAA